MLYPIDFINQKLSLQLLNPPQGRRTVSAMRKLRLILAAGILTLGTASPVYAHGGGLDWQGGHNCRVGSCAGTYHCHQARAGVCAPVKKSVKPTKKPMGNQGR